MKSKLVQANKIYKTGIENSVNRAGIITNMVTMIGCSAGYASTLYNKARIINKEQTVAPTLPNPKASINTFSKVAKMDKATIEQTRTDLEADLEAFFAKRGMSVKVGRISYSDTNFTTKLSVDVGSKDDAERAHFDRTARFFGLKPDHYGSIFTANGEKFRLIDFNLGAKKYPIVAERVSNSKRYKFGEEVLKQLK